MFSRRSRPRTARDRDLTALLTTRQFVRYGLLRLGLGRNLTGFRYGGQPRGLASEAEILARFPELAAQA